ncbi:hypothetical protein ABZ897_53725 [Nonomuraea sp. NPDC046802]|uniref:hypothetical protein n=1 Tax=Nonomuraea sp. NPDC046802 TaxID=3154919 RepID=UPI0033C960BA
MPRNAYTIDQAQQVLTLAVEQMTAAIQAAHPQPDCLPLPNLRVPTSLSDLEQHLQYLAENLWTNQGSHRHPGWIKARQCMHPEHAAEEVVLDIYELIVKWYQTLCDLRNYLLADGFTEWNNWRWLANPRDFYGQYVMYLDKVTLHEVGVPAPRELSLEEVTAEAERYHGHAVELGWETFGGLDSFVSRAKRPFMALTVHRASREDPYRRRGLTLAFRFYCDGTREVRTFQYGVLPKPISWDRAHDILHGPSLHSDPSPRKPREFSCQFNTTGEHA